MKIAGNQKRQGRRRAGRRGTADLETLAAVPILLGLLWLAKGSLELGVARMQNVFQAEEMAYSDATTPTASPAGSDTGNLAPIDGFDGALPDLGVVLPNRMHVGVANTTVTPTLNVPLPPATLTNMAAFSAPAWSYSAWPMGDQGGFQDATAMANWFTAYTAQVRTDTIETSLQLSPSSPP